MFDIGWTELLVIAVVLIVVVGPKDLPPMLRAFGKMTANFRKMAGDFRTQFDEALRESEMDDVRKTISDAQRLNPTNALRDAINPLRQMGQDIKSDLQKAAQPPSGLTGNASDMTSTDVEAQQAIEGAEPASAAPEAPVAIQPAAQPAVAAVAPAPAMSAPAAVPAGETKPAATAAVSTEPAKVAVPAKPRAARKPSAKATKPAVSASNAVVTEGAAVKPKRSRAAPKAETASVPAANTPARKRAAKKNDTPKDEA